jgi:hypothetical protein
MNKQNGIDKKRKPRSSHGKGRRKAVRGVLRVISARLSKKISYPTGYGKIKNNGGLNVVFPNTKTKR